MSAMSVRCVDNVGWVLDHHSFIDQSHTQVARIELERRDAHTKAGIESVSLPETRNFRCVPQLFDITSQYMMDSQFAAIYGVNSAIPNCDRTACQSRKGRKKRKRKHGLNEGEIAAANFHGRIISIIETAYDKLVNLAKKQGVFPEEEMSCPNDNNMAARLASKIEGPGTKLTEHCSKHGSLGGSECSDVDNEQFVSTMKDSGEECFQHVFLGDTYIIPPHSRYLLSNIEDVSKLLKMDDRYDLIVIDPPWENKSAKRLKCFTMLRNVDLLELPVPQLAREGCLIAVWVTNKQKEHLFVRNELFPKWNVGFLAQWIWLKVTTSGCPVYDLHSPHKKPYEIILLGKFKSGEVPKDESSAGPKDISSDKLIISIPCSIHSRKPPLFEILKDYIPRSPKCLEMFARNLLPGWTSWGNEVLKFQHMDFFEEVLHSV